MAHLPPSGPSDDIRGWLVVVCPVVFYRFVVYLIHGAGSNLFQHVHNFGRKNTEYVPYSCLCSGCFSRRCRSVVVQPTCDMRFCALVVLLVIGLYMAPGSCWVFPGSYRVTDSYISHETCVVIASYMYLGP